MERLPDSRLVRDFVEIDGIRPTVTPPTADETRGPARPFLMIWFRCCATYGRLPKARDGRRYAGNCPKCRAKLEVPVGEGGTRRRMFEAS